MPDIVQRDDDRRTVGSLLPPASTDAGDYSALHNSSGLDTSPEVDLQYPSEPSLVEVALLTAI